MGRSGLLKLLYMQSKLIKKVRTFVFGERARGEYAYKKPTFKTVYPDKQTEEFEWYKQLRVSCLYGKK
jgi:hypothetical protein